MLIRSTAWRCQSGVWVYVLRPGCFFLKRNDQGCFLNKRNALGFVNPSHPPFGNAFGCFLPARKRPQCTDIHVGVRKDMKGKRLQEDFRPPAMWDLHFEIKLFFSLSLSHSLSLFVFSSLSLSFSLFSLSYGMYDVFSWGACLSMCCFRRTKFSMSKVHG